MIKAVLFDFDDTLGNREAYSHQTYIQRIEELMPDEDPWLKECAVQLCLIYDQHGDVQKSYVRERLLAETGIDLGEDLKAYWAKHQCENAELYPDALPTLLSLRERGYKTGIITNGESHNQHRKIERCGADKAVDVIVVSGDTPYKKPQKEIFVMAAEQLGLACEECAFVGDMFNNDICGAYRAGMKPIWIWPHGDRYASFADVLQIRHLSDLLGIFK